jgi:ABC-2 type transport system ATP-binding protein
LSQATDCHASARGAALAPHGATGYPARAHRAREGRIVIEVAHLTKNYGDVEALAGLSLRVAEGEIYGLLGPNGAGKSTAVSILAGLVRPTSGTARIAGAEASSPEAKRALGLVPQDVVLYDDLNAAENLTFFGGLYGLGGAALKRRVDEMLDLVGLADRRREPVGRFSGGMKRRLNLACGLAHAPRALLLDEPTVGIDPQARLHILDLTRRIAREGTAVLYTTHYLHEAETLCDRIGIIDRGRILTEGTLEDLRVAVGERDIVTVRGAFDDEDLRGALGAIAGAEVLAHGPEEVLIACPRIEQALTVLMGTLGAIGRAREVSVRRPSLESLFIKLTGKELRE